MFDVGFDMVNRTVNVVKMMTIVKIMVISLMCAYARVEIEQGEK